MAEIRWVKGKFGKLFGSLRKPEVMITYSKSAHFQIYCDHPEFPFRVDCRPLDRTKAAPWSERFKTEAEAVACVEKYFDNPGRI